MMLGYITRWQTSYMVNDLGNVYMNLTYVDPVSEARRLRHVIERDNPCGEYRAELEHLVKMLDWVGNCPLRFEKFPEPKYSDKWCIRFQGLEHLNTDFPDLPVVVKSLTTDEVKKWAEERGLEWRRSSNFLFGGYFRYKGTGDCYYPDTDTEVPLSAL